MAVVAAGVATAADVGTDASGAPVECVGRVAVPANHQSSVAPSAPIATPAASATRMRGSRRSGAAGSSLVQSLSLNAVSDGGRAKSQSSSSDLAISTSSISMASTGSHAAASAYNFSASFIFLSPSSITRPLAYSTRAIALAGLSLSA